MTVDAISRSLPSARWMRTESHGRVEVVARDVAARKIDDEEHKPDGN